LDLSEYPLGSYGIAAFPLPSACLNIIIKII
jgi:hypothetical protein